MFLDTSFIYLKCSKILREVLEMKLDDIDISILSHMRDDAKLPLKELARELRVHPNTLLQRVRKLEKAGVIKKYVAEVDFDQTGLDLHVIINMKVTRGRASDLEQIKQLIGIKELEAIFAVSGHWDVIALCRVKNRKHFLEVIQKISDHPIVSKTSSSIILYEYKTPGDYNPFVYEMKKGKRR